MGPVTAYAVAIVAVVMAVLLRWLLDPVMGDALPLVTLFGAVAAAAWAGGYGPAILSMVAGYIACAYLFIEPRGALGLQLLHQDLEGELLVGRRAQGHVAHRVQQPAEARGAGEIRSHHQRVDEAADEPGELRALPTGHRDANRKVGLPGVPVQ